MSNPLTAALALGQKGFAVFPVKPNDKIPATGNGCLAATVDPDGIRAMFSTPTDELLGEVPYNIGIEASRSNLVQIDIDFKPKRDGLRSLAALEAQYGKLPETLRATTPNSGLHMYYRAPSVKLPNLDDVPLFGMGIEVKATNKYLVASPSMVDGKRYEWVNPECPVNDLPQWFIDLCIEAGKQTTRPSPQKPDKTKFRYSSSDVVDRFNRENSIEATLAQFGYAPGNQLDYMRHPNGDSTDSVHILHGMSYHFGAGDPLKGRGCGKEGNCFTPYHLIVAMEHQGDHKAAVKAIAGHLGMSNSNDKAQWDIPADPDPLAQPQALTEAMPDELPQFVHREDVRNLKWLWKHRIPLGCLTSLAGEQGVGKSTMLYDLIARLSNGLPMPDGEPTIKCKTLLLSFEDNPIDSAGPKLIAADADLSMIRKWPGVFTHHQLPKLEKYLKADPSVKLIVIEPIYEVGMDKIQDIKEVGQVLGAIQTTAATCEVAVMGVNHFRKGKADSSNEKTMNSTGFTSKPRACWGVVKKKDDPKTLIFALGKHNIRANKQALQFEIADATIFENGEEIETCKVVWSNERLDIDLDTLIRETDGKKTTADAREWLTGMLAGGEQKADTLLTVGFDAGYTRDQIYEAKNKIGAKAKRHRLGPGGYWTWQLTATESHHPPVEDESDDKVF